MRCARFARNNFFFFILFVILTFININSLAHLWRMHNDNAPTLRIAIDANFGWCGGSFTAGFHWTLFHSIDISLLHTAAPIRLSAAKRYQWSSSPSSSYPIFITEKSIIFISCVVRTTAVIMRTKMCVRCDPLFHTHTHVPGRQDTEGLHINAYLASKPFESSEENTIRTTEKKREGKSSKQTVERDQ